MMRKTLRGVAQVFTLWAVPAITAVQSAWAQNPGVGGLIRQARQQLEQINPDSAAVLLRQSLDPRAGATVSQKAQALVLVGATELIRGATDSARHAFHQALVLQPDLTVDTLADLHEALVATFEREKAALAAVAPPAPGVLEIRGLPTGAEVSVDGIVWTKRRQQVQPGVREIEVTARGYEPYSDSVVVGAGATVVTDIALKRSAPALLSVGSVPWGVVYLDSQRLGETPIFERAVEAGAYNLRLESPLRAGAYRQQVTLEAGEATSLGTLSEAALPPSDTGVLRQADSLFRAVEFDSALAVYRRVAWDTVSVRDPSVRARAATRVAEIEFAMAASTGDSSQSDSATAYFGAAYRTAPGYDPSPEMGPEMHAAMEAARARVLGLVVQVSPDTQLPARGGRFVIGARPTHAASVYARIVTAGEQASTLSADSQAVATAATFGWDLRLPDGTLLAPGRYVLMVGARDSAGQAAPAFRRLVSIERVAVDTLAHPAPPPASAFAPESLRLGHASGLVVVSGIALAAGTVALDGALSNAALKAGLPGRSGSYIVAGTISLAGLVGFLAGHRTRPLPENARRNQELRQRYARDVQAAIAENERRRREAPVRIRVLEGF